jgi:hypothetical protein
MNAYSRLTAQKRSGSSTNASCAAAKSFSALKSLKSMQSA